MLSAHNISGEINGEIAFHEILHLALSRKLENLQGTRKTSPQNLADKGAKMYQLFYYLWILQKDPLPLTPIQVNPISQGGKM